MRVYLEVLQVGKVRVIDKAIQILVYLKFLKPSKVEAKKYI